jgi:hypothetical protein
VSEGRDDDEGCRRPSGVKSLQHIQAAHPRHDDIRHDQISNLRRVARAQQVVSDQIEQLLTVLRHHDPMAVVAKGAAQRAPRSIIVIR